jgi:hypothetical protein
MNTKLVGFLKISLLVILIFVAVGVYFFHPYFSVPRQAAHVFNSSFSTSIDQITDLKLLSEPEGPLSSPDGCVAIRFNSHQAIILKDQDEYVEVGCPSTLPESGVLNVSKDTPLAEFKCIKSKADLKHENYNSVLEWHPATGMYYFNLCS